MKQSKWSDEQLTNLLKQLPCLKDERHPTTVYQQIIAKQKKHRRRNWMLPSIATIFSLFLFVVIINSIMNEGTRSSEKKSALQDRNLATIQSEEKMTKAENRGSTFDLANTKDVQLETNAVYGDDIKGKEVLTYPIPDENLQVVVPVSILVDNQQYANKFDLYKNYMKKLSEDSWNLKEYYPINADISFNSNKKAVIVNVEQAPSAFTSAGDHFYSAILNEQLHAVDAKKVLFFTKNKPGIIFGNWGEIRSHHYQELENRGYFLLHTGSEANNIYYVPSFDSYDTIEKAFYDMQNDQKMLGLSASLPNTIHVEKITSNHSKKQLIVFFTKDSKFEENLTTIRAIEAILLTAKDFHYSSVKFENTRIKQIGRFILSKEVKVPVAANKRGI